MLLLSLTSSSFSACGATVRLVASDWTNSSGARTRKRSPADHAAVIREALTANRAPMTKYASWKSFAGRRVAASSKEVEPLPLLLLFACVIALWLRVEFFMTSSIIVSLLQADTFIGSGADVSNSSGFL